MSLPHRLTSLPLFFALLIAPVTHAQAPAAHDWPAELIGKPLYLRGSWAADNLHFDASGKPLGDARIGPLTLSGFEAKRVTVNGRRMVLDGPRIALVSTAPDSSGLERRPVTSTTLIPFTIKPHAKDFHAVEQIHIVLEADEDGSFDRPVTRIFALGLAQLALTAPPYWRCYVSRYFKEQTAGAAAGVKRCVSSGEPIEADGTTEPVAISAPEPMLPAIINDLGASGEIVVHVRVSAEGMPGNLEIVQAVGAGAEESVLLALSKWTFIPAMHAGSAVPSLIDVTFKVEPRH